MISPLEAGKKAEALAQQRASTSPLPHRLETLLAHAGVTPGENAALSPALEMATTYVRPAAGPYQTGDSIYTRCDNPTRMLLEREVERLECRGRVMPEDKKSCYSFAFSSGMMAASSIILAHEAPLTVILHKDLYHGVPTVLMDVFSRFQVQTIAVDLTDVHNLDKELPAETYGGNSTAAAIVWIETPSNPLVQVLDIEAICQHLSNRPNVTIVVDSTLAPPVVSQPLLLGADIVMHSATKYLGGHSDVLLGVVTVSPLTPKADKLADRLKGVQVDVGGVAAPMDCWLCLRGLRTLALRVTRQSATALQLALHLSNKEGVRVHYPGLESHPQHDVAKRQMKGAFGGVLSVEFETESMAMAFAGALQTIYRATSLGGTETLVEHRASIEPPGRVTSPSGLLRVSIGLEDAADLIEDIDRALEIAKEAAN